MRTVYNPFTGEPDYVNDEFVPSEENLKPPVSVPSVTLFHNASIPASAGNLCVCLNFEVQAKFIGTYLDNTIDNNFWNWSQGFELIRRTGAGPSDILIDKQTITAQKAIRVKPVGDGKAILCASIGTGNSCDYFQTADGDRFPVYDLLAAEIGTLPQLRAANGGSSTFTANFGSSLAVERAGTSNRFKVFSQNGKVIEIGQGSSADVVYLDAAHNMCHGGAGGDVTATTASLLNSIPATGQARFAIYVNEDNDGNEYLEHDFAFVPHDLQIPLDDLNHCITVKYNALGATKPLARWNASRVEANMAGAANITLKASFVERPNQAITGS